ncbi:MAG: 3-deoxy-manno-octulosonate cytidylyltransferase [Bacteroidetes bacterium]|nr:MAG: 3-deoxy-manno-octulosonate cytidylyltransferase [Bacteroidota bacterium]
MILGVIPARYASSRFPGKPLAQIKGMSMIARVYAQCLKARSLDEVMVATDDERIFSHVVRFGGKAIMTASTHASGTERVSEVAAHFPQYTHFVNIQGDEPFIAPAQIDLVGNMLKETDAPIVTVVKPLTSVSQLSATDNAKVVLDHEGHALYFSRSPIPHFKNVPMEQWPGLHPYYLHVGIYGFRREVLLAIPGMKPSALEQAESLEQLRWLANGYRIRTAISHYNSISIDTPQDLEQLLENL